MVNLFLDNIFYFQQNVEDKTSWNKLKELSNDIDKNIVWMAIDYFT